MDASWPSGIEFPSGVATVICLISSMRVTVGRLLPANCEIELLLALGDTRVTACPPTAACNGGVDVAGVEAVARTDRPIRDDLDIGLADCMEHAEIGHAPDLRENVHNLIRLWSR